LRSQDRAARRGGKIAEGELVVASKLGLIAFCREYAMVAFGSHGGANGDGRSRFLVAAIELCGLWLKYNSIPIDYG
jgi:hypothetical protein